MMKGLTLIELLVVAFILFLLLASLLVVLTVGEFSSSLSSAKLDLQAKARNVLDTIVKDTRQAICYNIVNNNPSTTHLKFNLWDWDLASKNWLLSDDYIEYDYDANLSKLRRRRFDSSGNVTGSWEFNNIIEPPFYTTYNETTKTFIESGFCNYKKMLVVIKTRAQVRGALELISTLKAEVKIRNG